MDKNETLLYAQRPTILIVDDTRANLEVMTALLSKEYQVQVAGNGGMALDIAQTSPHPDLILLDINMPEMDGYEVCRRLTDNPVTRAIPVMFITSASDSKSETYCLQLGAVDFITKPINPTITLLRVRNQLMIKESLEKQRLASSVFENTMECIIVTDAQNKIVDINPAFTKITGYRRDEAIGKNPQFMQSGHQEQSFFDAIGESLDKAGSWKGEIWNKTKAGDCYPELISISAIRNDQDITTHFVYISSDIRLLKEYEKHLEHTAYFDALTGIPNRILLADRLKQAISQAKRKESILAVCYLDLDGFKPVNDTLGHGAGDEVLIEIALRIKAILREVDTVARIGGDEFVVLLPDLSHLEDYSDTLTRLQEAVGLPIKVQDHVFVLSVSIGITLFPFDDADADGLLRHADKAMYIAKQAGKNCCHLFEPIKPV